MSLIRYSFNKTIAEFCGAIAKPRILGMAILTGMLSLVYIVLFLLKRSEAIHKIQVKFLETGISIYILLISLIFIIQSIDIYKYIKNRRKEESEIKGELGIKYIKITLLIIGISIIATGITIVDKMVISELSGKSNAVKIFNFLKVIVLIYGWSKIFIIPYTIIIDNEKNPVSKSLKLTKKYSWKIFYSVLLLWSLSYFLLTILSCLHFENLLMRRMVISFIYWVIMSIFINVFYINIYERLKELNDSC